MAARDDSWAKNARGRIRSPVALGFAFGGCEGLEVLLDQNAGPFAGVPFRYRLDVRVLHERRRIGTAVPSILLILPTFRGRLAKQCWQRWTMKKRSKEVKVGQVRRSAEFKVGALTIDPR